MDSIVDQWVTTSGLALLTTVMLAGCASGGCGSGGAKSKEVSPPWAVRDVARAEVMAEPEPSPVGREPRAAAKVFWLGHSLVNVDMPFAVKGLAGHAGVAHDYREHVMPGASLKALWDNPDRVNKAPIYDARLGRDVDHGVSYRTSLPTGQFDVVVMTELVPIDRNYQYFDTSTYVGRFYDLATAANPSAQIYVYETWDHVPAGDFEAWASKVTFDLKVWESVVDVAMARHPRKPPILIIPAGQAMLALHRELAKGQIGTLVRIGDLFADDIHLNHVGNYFIASIMYATIYRRSPVGLGVVKAGPYTQEMVVRDEASRQALQRIAWEAVRAYPHSGVR